MLCIISWVLFGCFVAKSQSKDTALEGFYHAWWSTIPLPIETVKQMIPVGMYLNTPILEGLPADTHPVVLELGYEWNCGPIDAPIFQSNFSEFKFDIPFVRRDGVDHDFNFKKLIYLEDYLLVISSRDLYSLDAKEATFDIGYNVGTQSKNDFVDHYYERNPNNMDNGAYKVYFEEKTLNATFTPSGEWTVGLNAYPHSNFFEVVMAQTWFGALDESSKCADHFYEYREIQIRPARIELQVEKDLLSEFFPDDLITREGVDRDSRS